jgi:hypothetical protein
MLRAQLRDKEAKEQWLLQTIADLQVWLQAVMLFKYITLMHVKNGQCYKVLSSAALPLGAQWERCGIH